MDLASKVEEANVRKLVGRYNMLVNLFWSIVNLTPIGIFWYRQVNHNILYIFLALSLFPILWPRKVFHSLKLGSRSATYKRAGVAFVIRFTQNGRIINALIKNKFPSYRVVSARSSSVEHLISQTYMFEKFHYIFLLFFLLTLVHTILNHLFWWSLVIIITNILYNIYPILIQQYIRLKLGLVSKRA